MPKVTDLYPILKAYASKHNTPYIDIDVFLDFLKNAAQYRAQEQPDWNKWLTNTGTVFWNELSGLVESGKCALLTTTSGGAQVYMPHFYLEMLDKIYHDIDKMANQPFPSEESLGMTIPENQMTVISLKNDFGQFFGEEKDKEESNNVKTSDTRQIAKIVFPENYGSALLLIGMIPRRFLEAAFLKMRHYLQITGNKEYILHKLSPQLQNREKFLIDMLDQARIRPIECLNEMEKSGDFSYLFW
ncbi:MAG: hypothetical protein LBH43_05935, partial [Treponema sp.]|nr:hypothetical protein [Treponema sp.]